LGVTLVAAPVPNATADAILPSLEANVGAKLVPQIGGNAVHRECDGPFPRSRNYFGSEWTSAFAPPSQLGAGITSFFVAEADLAAAKSRPDFLAGPLPSGWIERLSSGRVDRSPELATDTESGTNIRIPEPASLTLVAAGIVGLAARQRLRRNARVELPEAESD
jgi:hypothetical protein